MLLLAQFVGSVINIILFKPLADKKFRMVSLALLLLTELSV